MRKYFALFLIFAIASCGGDLQLSVKDRWEKGVRNFALKPIYPMREDVFVGTVRLVADEDRPFDILSRNFGYIDLTARLTELDKQLPSLPATSNPTEVTISQPSDDETKSPTVLTKWGQPTNTAGVFGGNRNTQNRLRLAALPGVSVVQISEADFAQNNLLSSLASSYRQNANLNINLSAVESVEIDDVTAFRSFLAHIDSKFRNDPWFAQTICHSSATMDVKDFRNVQLQMVTRVFYARGIVYNYGSSVSASLNQATGANSGSGSSLPTSTTTAGTAAGSVTAPGVTTTPAVPDPANPAPPPEPQPETVTPGTVARISAQRAEGSSLTEVFERPMAFGVATIAVSPSKYGLSCKDGLPQWAEGAPFFQTSTVVAPGKFASPSAVIPPTGDQVLTGEESCQSFLNAGVSQAQVDALAAAGACKP